MGRAALVLMGPDRDRYRDELRAACLHNGQWDVQTEDERAPYLARLVRLLEAEDDVVGAIRDDFPEASERDRELQGGLLAELAAGGYTGASTVWRDLGIEPDEEPDPVALVSLPRYTAPPPILMAAELMAEFRAAPRRPLGFTVRFGLHASDEELRRWAALMLEERDPQTLRTMAEAFVVRPWPLEVASLIARIDVDDGSARVWRRLLRRRKEPIVRALALERLAKTPPDEDAVGWLIASYRLGDEPAILAALRRVVEMSDLARHALGSDLLSLGLSEAGPFVPHLEWVVENTPCSHCRCQALEGLSRRGALSEAYRRELPYDAEEKTRALA
jgi:hypothetical protein